MSGFVDSTVWIDYLRGTATPQADLLGGWLNVPGRIIVGDLVLVEVLQGCDSPREADDVLELMSLCEQIDIVGRDVAIAAAMHYRTLRAKGVTVRKTIDTLIATWCIRNDVALLHRDRDFEPFVEHLGLKSAMMLN